MGSAVCTSQRFAATQQFGVNLGEFFQPLPVGLVMAHALFGPLLLSLILEQEFQHLPGDKLDVR